MWPVGGLCGWAGRPLGGASVDPGCWRAGAAPPGGEDRQTEPDVTWPQPPPHHLDAQHSAPKNTEICNNVD